MRLIELTANQKSFRSVRFNETGLTLIVGRKSDPDDTSLEHSTNGVGKSLLLYLVSFCLGSNANKELKEKLPDWEFSLEFEMDGKPQIVTRSTAKQNRVNLDGAEISLTEYRIQLGTRVFGIPPSTKNLTFRALIGLFVRLGKAAYISEDQTSNRETPFAKQLRNSYLLGLDEQLAIKKLELREEFESLESIRKQFKKDSLLRDFFQGDKDVSLELKDLDEEIEDLEKKASAFQVAENYEDIVAEAESTKAAWRRASNELNFLQSALQQIEASLVEQPDVSAEEVRRMYEAAMVELPLAVKQQLEAVTDFHRELVESRSRRLTLEKHQIERDILQTKKQITDLDAKKDEYYRFLGSHGAFQEYEALHSKLSDRKLRASRLREFKRLEEDCRERTQRNKLEMSQENIRTTEYLQAAKDITDHVSMRFRSMARRIWPTHTCGLVIRNNEGENKVRYDIDPRIQGDASDGISETKIFCFDMTVLVGKRNHSIDFLMHDNRLFQGIDPRQCVELFRIADEVSRQNGCQYIASLNEATLHTLKDNMADPIEFSPLFESNTVLELTDDSDSGKLLGITVDLHYEKIPKTEGT